MTDTEYDSDFPPLRTTLPIDAPSALELGWITEHCPPPLAELADEMAAEAVRLISREHVLQRMRQMARRRRRRQQIAANFVI